MEFKNIKSLYEELPMDSTEEDMKIHIVIEVLIMLGYKKEMMKFESRQKDRRGVVDILIDLLEENKIIVEIKRKKSILDDDSKAQLINYLNDRNCTWGILTNGNEYLLANKDLKGNINDKYFLKFRLSDNNCKMNWNIFKFFSYENIFKLRTTEYFMLYKIFSVSELSNKKNIIESQYRSACYKFFIYLSNKRYSKLELNYNNFEEMIFESKNKLSVSTIKNKFRYIKSFLNFLEKKELVAKNLFSGQNIEDIISKLENKETRSIIDLDNKKINYIKDFHKDINLKNQIIVLLFLYTLNYNLIINLKKNDYLEGYIKYKNKTIKIPKYIDDCIKEFVKYNKIKKGYILTNAYANKKNHIKEYNIRNALKEVIKDDYINRNIFQKYFINEMYKQGISLETLADWLELDVSTVFKWIDQNLVKNKLKKERNKLIKKHVYVK